jgi:hypothetical protein
MGGKRYSKTEMEAAYATGMDDGLKSATLAIAMGARLGKVGSGSAGNMIFVIETAIGSTSHREKAIKAKAEDPAFWVQSLLETP